MIHKIGSPTPGHVRVIFELPACIWADRIFVTGDFNSWDKTATPLRQDRDGVWRAMLDLRTGSRYEFRYLIDGEWSTDFHADGCTTNIHGSQNSIVIAELTSEPKPGKSQLAGENTPALSPPQTSAHAPVQGQSRRGAA